MLASRKITGILTLVVIAAAVFATTLIGTGAQSANASGHVQTPGLSVPYCESNGIFMYWHTENYGNATAPDGWRIERRYRDNHEWVTKSWEFTGAQSDALQVYSDRYWDWKDRSRVLGVRYTYRVRAIDSDSTYTAGRDWSSRVLVSC